MKVNKDWWREGQKLEVLTYPDPILKKVAEPVTVFDEALAQLCQNMLHTMYGVPGIGLAAPQVGVSQRVFVMDVDHQREGDGQYSNLTPRVFINPVISHKYGETTYREGCLSIPGVYEEVHRAESVTVKYQCLKGEEHTLEADALLAICLQHENDHLDGIVFLDRLSLLKRDILMKKFFKKRENLEPRRHETP